MSRQRDDLAYVERASKLVPWLWDGRSVRTWSGLVRFYALVAVIRCHRQLWVVGVKL